MIDSPQGEVIFPEVRSQEGSWYPVGATQGLAAVTVQILSVNSCFLCELYDALCTAKHPPKVSQAAFTLDFAGVMLDLDLFIQWPVLGSNMLQ